MDTIGSELRWCSLETKSSLSSWSTPATSQTILPKLSEGSVHIPSNLEETWLGLLSYCCIIKQPSLEHLPKGGVSDSTKYLALQRCLVHVQLRDTDDLRIGDLHYSAAHGLLNLTNVIISLPFSWHLLAFLQSIYSLTINFSSQQLWSTSTYSFLRATLVMPVQSLIMTSCFFFPPVTEIGSVSTKLSL